MFNNVRHSGVRTHRNMRTHMPTCCRCRPELRKVALTLFNVEPAHHTPEQLEDKFKQADSDRWVL